MTVNSDLGGLIPNLMMEEAYSPNSPWPVRLDRMDLKSKSFG